LIDHQILGLHHVLPSSENYILYDMLFLASGLLLIAVGYFMTSRARGGSALGLHTRA
jgi:uncharacterized membrane protein